MLDFSGTVFRLVAVLKLARLVEEAMPQLVAAKVVAPTAAASILSAVEQLKTDTDRQEVHTPDELDSIALRTEFLNTLLAERSEYLTAKQRESHANIMRVLAAKNGKALADALRQLT